MEVSGQLHTPPDFIPRENISVLIEQEDEQAQSSSYGSEEKNI
jgi:hypothetical protein